ncbi:MAG: transglutaminase, partial [Mastigocladus sp. ERB_26_1]
FPKYGWFAFDPIPNHPLIPPSIEDEQTFNTLRQFWNWVAGWLPSPVTGLLNYVFGTIFTWISKAFSWFLSLFYQGWLGVFTALIFATTAAFLSWLGWDRWREWCYHSALRKLPPMERLYQQMLCWTSQQGLVKHPAQTPLEYATILYQHHATATAEVIEEISQAYVSWRYGGHTHDVQRLQQKWQEMKKTTKKLKLT